MTQKDIALIAAKALDDKRAKDIVVLKVDEMTVLTDYMVIATGRSVPQVKALADDVDDRMAELGVAIRRSEGANDGRWIILDYGHIMVHIFHQEERQFYNLERLWEDGNNRLVLPFDQSVLD